MKTALVLGAGGFIGSHMVKRLKKEGYWVRGVDLKYPEFEKTVADEFIIYDLCIPMNMKYVLRIDIGNHGLPMPFSATEPPFSSHKTFDEIYQFAALMGGAGFIFTGDNDARIMSRSVMINTNLVYWLIDYAVWDESEKYKFIDAPKLFYSSSACMYPQGFQIQSGLPGVGGLSEDMAYPANPDSEYGWEKLFSERLYLAYARNYGLNVRIARFHNIYGPEGTYKGGKEKAPAAMCRKVVEAKDHKWPCADLIEVWGDGKQTRSFLYIDDCIDAVRLLMESDFKEPINIGSEEMISINDLAQMAIDISGKSIKIKNIDGPVGVRGRNSNNDLIRKVLNWNPKFSLRQGMELTYNWIKSQYGTTSNRA